MTGNQDAIPTAPTTNDGKPSRFPGEILVPHQEVARRKFIAVDTSSVRIFADIEILGPEAPRPTYPHFPVPFRH
jgi:hypothetical protein